MRDPKRSFAAVVEGTVVHGDGRGRQLGFPTANVEISGGDELPPDGIYAGWLEREDGSRYAAAVSVGTRPTYYGEHGALLVEAHVLDFDDDLYGEKVSIGVSERVRGQVRFPDEDALVAQMVADVAAVRAVAGPA